MKKLFKNPESGEKKLNLRNSRVARFATILLASGSLALFGCGESSDKGSDKPVGAGGSGIENAGGSSAGHSGNTNNSGAATSSLKKDNEAIQKAVDELKDTDSEFTQQDYERVDRLGQIQDPDEIASADSPGNEASVTLITGEEVSMAELEEVCQDARTEAIAGMTPEARREAEFIDTYAPYINASGQEKFYTC